MTVASQIGNDLAAGIGLALIDVINKYASLVPCGHGLLVESGRALSVLSLGELFLRDVTVDIWNIQQNFTSFW
jgi:hypothetical protein